MNQETINLLAHKAEVKIDKLNESKLKYLVLSMFAGMFVGLGCILIYSPIYFISYNNFFLYSVYNFFILTYNYTFLK